MNNVYELIKRNTDGTTTSWGFYEYQKVAEKEMKENNDSVIRQLMIRANRLNGAIRGKNQDVFHELMKEAQNPAWSVKKHSVNSRYY